MFGFLFIEHDFCVENVARRELVDNTFFSGKLNKWAVRNVTR